MDFTDQVASGSSQADLRSACGSFISVYFSFLFIFHAVPPVVLTEPHNHLEPQKSPKTATGARKTPEFTGRSRLEAAVVSTFLSHSLFVHFLIIVITQFSLGREMKKKF